MSADATGATFGARWRTSALIGRGKYGDVFGSIDDETGDEVAVKLISKDASSSQVVLKEVEIMKRMSHPNVVALLDVGESNSHYFIVMDLCRGDLFDRIELCGWFDEDEALHYMNQLAAGVAACHAAGIVHRDIKPENLLLDANDNLKITDFGLASAFLNVDQNRMLCGTPCGSPKYASPQVILGHHQSYDAQAADVWSMGVCLFVMTMGAFPFLMASAQHCEEFSNYLTTSQLQFPERGSPDLEAVLHQMLAIDQADRPSAAALSQIWSQGDWWHKADEDMALDPAPVELMSIVGKSPSQLPELQPRHSVVRCRAFPRSPLPVSTVTPSESRAATLPSAARSGYVALPEEDGTCKRGFHFKLPSQQAYLRFCVEPFAALEVIAEAARSAVGLLDPSAEMVAQRVDDETMELLGRVNGAYVASRAVAMKCEDADGCQSAVVLTRIGGDLMAHRSLLMALKSNPSVAVNGA
jgi:serine/threonine protein kinase